MHTQCMCYIIHCTCSGRDTEAWYMYITLAHEHHWCELNTHTQCIHQQCAAMNGTAVTHRESNLHCGCMKRHLLPYLQLGNILWVSEWVWVDVHCCTKLHIHIHFCCIDDPTCISMSIKTAQWLTKTQKNMKGSETLHVYIHMYTCTCTCTYTC